MMKRVCTVVIGAAASGFAVLFVMGVAACDIPDEAVLESEPTPPPAAADPADTQRPAIEQPVDLIEDETPTPAPEPTPTLAPEPTPTPEAAGYSRAAPADIGTPLTAEIDILGDKYEVQITLEEAIRGADAWTLIQEANMFNDPPDEGFEYVLVRIRIELLSAPTDTRYDVSPARFAAVSGEGKDYDRKSLVAPEPNLRASMYAGADHEGWAVYTVADDDDIPLLTYGRDFRGRGGVWWKLYDEGTPESVP